MSEADCSIKKDAMNTAPIATTSAEDLYKKDSCKVVCDGTIIILKHAVLKKPENVDSTQTLTAYWFYFNSLFLRRDFECNNVIARLWIDFVL